MSSDSDLERLLREASESLPSPDAGVTAEARGRALESLRPRRGRLRGVLVIGGALVVAIGLGVGLGALLTPSGSAARGPIGIGFLPENGWNVVQSGTPATVEQPAYAVAANVRIASEDLVSGGAPDPSGLPYATLLNLRSQGIVIVATFTRLTSEGYVSGRPPEQTLPLRMREAMPNIVFGTQVRPEQPLGEYQLRAIVNAYDVNLDIYFGSPTPTEAMLDAAQRQIDRLVVRGPRGSDSVNRPQRPSSSVAPARGIIDRALVCSTALAGGAREIEVKGHKGTGRNGSIWNRPAFVALTSGSAAFGGLNPSGLDNSLAWVTAGRPSVSSTFVEGNPLSELYRVRTWGTLAVNGQRCRPTKERVALSRAGLSGGALGPFDEGFECVVPRRVLVRVHGVLPRATGLKGYRAFLRTTLPVSEGRLAVRSESGRLLAYAEVFDSGKARLFIAPSCSPS